MNTIPAWLYYAIGSAVASALVGVCMKFGTTNVDSTLATTLRAIMMTGLLVIIWVTMGTPGKLNTLTPPAFASIALSAIAGAAAWLCYFRAIAMSDVSKVAPLDKLSVVIATLLAVIFLGERPGMLSWLGIALIAVGTYLVAIPKAGT